MFKDIHDKCGVFGIYDKGGVNVKNATYYALYALQHRGQEGCGITINDNGAMFSYKGSGLVGEVFTHHKMASMRNGNLALGHTLYGEPTQSTESMAQPLVVHMKGPMALAFNGALTNSDELRQELESTGAIFQTACDADIISHVITRERLTSESIDIAIGKAMHKLEGAYSLVVMSASKLIAVRDPYGFRPLCMGKIGESIAFASESCALDSIGATFVRDVEPGEIIVVRRDGIFYDRQHCGTRPHALCAFELVYFARPDSVVDGISVQSVRQQAGAFLAREHPVAADIVIGVPDSGIDAAIGYAYESGIPYGLGMIKNKYVGRTFLQQDQTDREAKVRIKLNTISNVVKNKRVVLVDDSIIRGTTSAWIVGILRDAGAREVHMRVSSPPFLHPCHYGTNIKNEEKLIACHHNVGEIAGIIGVDSLGYLSIASLSKLAGDRGLCSACFDGKYPCAHHKACESHSQHNESKTSQNGGCK